jgi:hypothetical protein
MNDNNESTKGGSAVPTLTPLLKAFEDILHNRITQKKDDMHKTQNITDTETEYGQR